MANPVFDIFLCIHNINASIAIFGVVKYKTDLFHDGDIIDVKIGFKEIIYMLSVVGISISFAIIWIFCMSSCAMALIKFSLIFELILEFGLGIFLLFINPISSIFPFIFGLIRLLWMIYIWKLIPFAQSLFAVALKAFRQYWYPVLLNLLMIILVMVVFAVDSLSFFTLNKIFHGDAEHISLFSVGFIELVFIFWHILALQNVCHVTSCGVMIQYLNNQRISMWNKFVLSVTKLFGAICFGTLLEAVLRKLILNQQRRSAQINGNVLQLCCIVVFNV